MWVPACLSHRMLILRLRRPKEGEKGVFFLRIMTTEPVRWRVSRHLNTCTDSHTSVSFFSCTGKVDAVISSGGEGVDSSDLTYKVKGRFRWSMEGGRGPRRTVVLRRGPIV